MPDPKPDARDVYFSTLRELESRHTQCATKARFIEGVMSGREQVTFAVIDRCREAALQIRQSAHVFRTLQEALAGDMPGTDTARVSVLRAEVEASVGEVAAALREIVSWVPEAVNSRATPTTGFAR